VRIPGAAGNASWLAEHTSVALRRTAPAGSAVERLASAIAAVDAEATGLGVGERVGFPTAVGVLATALAGPSTTGHRRRRTVRTRVCRPGRLRGQPACLGEHRAAPAAHGLDTARRRDNTRTRGGDRRSGLTAAMRRLQLVFTIG